MVEVSKPVNLGQLSAELGGVPLWSSGPDADGVTTVWGEVDSAALAGAVALLDPQAIVLAGGVANSLDVLEPMITEALYRQLPPHLRGIGTRAGRFGSRAGIVGASFAGALGPTWRTRNG